MSTDPTTNPPPSEPHPLRSNPPRARGPEEIKLVSHSSIFYWWPIWLLGYILALVTLMEDNRLAIIPPGAKVKLVSTPGKEPREYTMTVSGTTKTLDNAAEYSVREDEAAFPTRVSQKAWMGPVYCVILLVTILITNIPLRGLWSFLVILLMLLIALVITLVPNGWDSLLGAFGHLHIYINLAGYLFIATAVLVLWAVSVFIFDQRTYMIVTRGQIRVCEHIGASTRAFDTVGISFEKQRDDMFRHWILGFFSGDLIVRTSGAERETIRLPNVLWIGWRLDEIQRLLQERMVVTE